ncbi:helix-turn-helix transcriptional regulator [Glutamicibacter sp.]|uniref:helix-turn-helix domain-containing protein n=1 Tax=Glutamicibacter sp. TaxID=1931995 RepID=UPI0028BE8A88|nr:helix-turn-helix transcriptional regulator [Glutamicibacter sp.]
MSSYECPEIGCDYHVGISNGPNLTELDWEVEQNYFDDIDRHIQNHDDERQFGPGRRLKALRESKKLARAQLAARLCGLGLYWSTSVLSKVERGEREIRLNEVPIICMALDLERIQDFWSPGTIPARKRLTAVEALAEIRVIVEQIDSMTKEVPPAAATAEGDETNNPER